MHPKRVFSDICIVLLFAVVGTACCAVSPTVYAAATTETLVFVRHGEKPLDVTNGQLTCQGFNRSLALAPVLLSKFGPPDYLFAAAPEQRHDDNGTNYWYLRALATIEPTAVAAGRTINLSYDKTAIDDLEKELMRSPYQSAHVLVAWEHNEMDQLVQNIVHDNGGDSSIVPAWPDTDYDSIFVVSLVRDGGNAQVSFTHDQEGLDTRDAACPTRQSHGRPPLLIPPPVRPSAVAMHGRAALH